MTIYLIVSASVVPRPLNSLCFDADDPPAELLGELARAAYGGRPGDTLDQTQPGIQEGYRETVRRILRALAEKVKA